MTPLRFPEHRTLGDDAGDLANGPSGGRGTMYVAGIGLALIPVIYGWVCLERGWTPLFGSRSPSMLLRDTEAQALAMAYIALGAFGHFHWFWGLHPRLYHYSQPLKKLALVVFLVPFLWVIWQVVSWSFPA